MRGIKGERYVCEMRGRTEHEMADKYDVISHAVVQILKYNKKNSKDLIDIGQLVYDFGDVKECMFVELCDANLERKEECPSIPYCQHPRHHGLVS
jgi:hypothetical protein